MKALQYKLAFISHGIVTVVERNRVTVESEDFILLVIKRTVGGLCQNNKIITRLFITKNLFCE